MAEISDEKIKPGDWVEGPFWQDTVQVINIQPQNGYDIVTVFNRPLNLSKPYILTNEDWNKVHPISPANRISTSFEGSPLRFRLAMQAYRLKLAHAVDPYAGLNSSRIDPLPHQFEAVYQHLLARPVVRALLAHDAGAGKTIMAGLLIKELKRRQDVHRVLIVAPAALTIQWRRELITKFGEDFTVISREYMQDEKLDRLDVFRRTDLAITSLAFVRQREICRALESVEWDLVIVDEAHKLAAYRRNNSSVQKTLAYELGEVLSRRSRHFLLMTATPHKGDPENYRLLIRLLDPQWGDAAAYAPGSNPMVLRRTKEEMRTPDGKPLYPARIVETIPYSLSHDEGDLLEQVYKFIRKRFEKAKSTNRQSAAFALMTLSRRLASSPYSLLRSLERIHQKAIVKQYPPSGEIETREMEEWGDWDELSDEEHQQIEQQSEEEAARLVDLKQLTVLIEKNRALIVKSSQKIQELRKAVDLWVGERHRQIIVFTEFKDTLDELDRCIHEWGYTTTQIHGGMPMEDRRKAEKTFWEGKAQVLVATEAAGEGINLQCCNVMVNFDLPWNPTRLEQRMGRIHRYGQKESQVFIFNLLARNSMEDEVKETLLNKLNEMRKDLGDQVFDVVGNVLWGENLRSLLERVALGDAMAVKQAKQVIEEVEIPVRQAIEAEQEVSAFTLPLDIAGFQRLQAQFKANRLSPESAEAFLRDAVPFLGGTLHEFQVKAEDQKYPAFEMVLPLELVKGKQKRRKVSFWPEACSDDDIDPEGVLFIAPGSSLFDRLVDAVIQSCRQDLSQGAVFFDLQPESSSPYLVWFLHADVRDGLDRRAGEFLAALQHRADQEKVTLLPSEILDGFDDGFANEVPGGSSGHMPVIQQVHPMLAGQDEVIDQSVTRFFLPQLNQIRPDQQEIYRRDYEFLHTGLTRFVEYLNDAALDAYSSGNESEANHLTDSVEIARLRLEELRTQMTCAANLALLEPEVVGVILVLPAPVPISGKPGTMSRTPSMHRDPLVEQAAMQKALDHEASHGRYPRNVSQGKSWDIESCDAMGRVVRYIEVKGRGPGEAEEVWLTGPEWEAARRLGDQHWLYIVRLEDVMLWMIRNPYLKLQPKELKRWIVKIEDAAPVAETDGNQGS
jgi:superfamily II DNA or RNA helicase